jgi:hypothetical protein
LVLKAPDPDWIRIGFGLDPDPAYWIRIRIGIQPKMLELDPDGMNADPQPCAKVRASTTCSTLRHFPKKMCKADVLFYVFKTYETNYIPDKYIQKL